MIDIHCIQKETRNFRYNELAVISTVTVEDNERQISVIARLNWYVQLMERTADQTFYAVGQLCS